MRQNLCMNTEYKIVTYSCNVPTSSRLAALEDKVNKLIEEEGFEPQGGVLMYPDSFGQMVVGQTMIRKPPTFHSWGCGPM